MNVLEQLLTPGAALASVVGFALGVIYDRLNPPRRAP